jgi:hypothetical protein
MSCQFNPVKSASSVYDSRRHYKNKDKMSGGFNVMEEEGFDAKDNEGFDEEGFEDSLAEEGAMASATLDAIAEDVKMDALAEKKMFEEDLQAEKKLLSIKILE